MPNLAQKAIRVVFQKFAQKVQGNHLFEQEDERVPHPPLQLEKPEVKESKINLVSAKEVSELISSCCGWQLVHHWATWCDGCMEEIEDIQRFSEQLLENEISTMGVSWELFNGTPPQHAIPVVRHVHLAHGLSFPSHIVQGDPDEFFTVLRLEAQQIPQTALYKNGECVYSHMGILGEEERESICTIIEGTRDE
jgi:hypothetical protein